MRRKLGLAMVIAPVLVWLAAVAIEIGVRDTLIMLAALFVFSAWVMAVSYLLWPPHLHR